MKIGARSPFSADPSWTSRAFDPDRTDDSAVAASLVSPTPEACSLSLLDQTNGVLSTFAISASRLAAASSDLFNISVVPTGCRSATAFRGDLRKDHRTILLDQAGRPLVLDNPSVAATGARVRVRCRPRYSDARTVEPALQLHVGLDPSAPVVHSAATDGLLAGHSETTILSSLDGRPVRIKLARGPNGLVGRCLDALDFVLEADEATRLRSSLARTGGGTVAEWDPFVNNLLGLVGLQNRPPSAPPAVRSPWDRVKQSPQHSRDVALSTLEPWVDASERRLGRAPTGVDLARVARVTGALHLLAEDCKLSLVRMVDLERLGQLIATLAAALGRADWVDYWRRIVPVKLAHESYEGQSSVPKYLDSLHRSPLRPSTEWTVN